MQRHFQCSSDTSSARISGEMLHCEKVFLILPRLKRCSIFFKSFFRLCAKPVLIMVKNFSSVHSVKKSFEIFSIKRIAESTFGFGLKYRAGTVLI